MPNPADKEAISAQLQETIEKLEDILVQIKANPKRNYPSSNLVKRLRDATDSLQQNSLAKPSLLRQLTPFLATVLLVALLGGGIYFYNQNRADLTQVAQAPAKTSQEEPSVDLLPIQEPDEPTTTIAPEQQEPTTTGEIEQQELGPQEVALTPEQTFLAGIKKSISSYNTQLHDELIAAVKVDFERSFLQIKLEPIWNELNEPQQDRLADDLWRHARDMAFDKIELTDTNDVVLARSPVVGKAMVILQRSTEVSM